MMRLPKFRFFAPTSLAEAAKVLAGEGPDAMLLAGGTDLLPNMKRRQQQPRTLVTLSRVPELKGQSPDGEGLSIGAFRTLSDLSVDSPVRAGYAALQKATSLVATPLIRNQATLGGNLCLDTRCNYYNQSAEWRKAIDNCMKAPREAAGVFTEKLFLAGSAERQQRSGDEPGSICWVAPGSPRCWAVSSSDSAPALIALGAEVVLVSHEGERKIPLAELYSNDGMAYLNKRPDEILTRVLLPSAEAMKSTYWKLRRRGSFDFPVLGVGASVTLAPNGEVTSARIVLGAVASHPVVVEKATSVLVGGPLSDERIAAAADAAVKLSKPLDNTDFALGWRKNVTRTYVEGVLKELRGDAPETLGLLARRAQRAVALPVIQPG
ncbi:MAG: FAD binding domain-containing protein [Polyangiaceae bacterium]